MKDEVEDFLRRVAQMRAQAEAQARQRSRQAPPQSQHPPRPPRQQPPQRLVPQAPDPAYAPPVPVEVIVDAELADNADRVARQVAADLRGTDQIAEHTRHLGEEVDQADDKLESHLHQVFDHQLGKLKKTASTTAAAPYDSPASDMSELLQMLRSPKSVRDAIVMAEVLRRPDDRW